MILSLASFCQDDSYGSLILRATKALEQTQATAVNILDAGYALLT